MKYINKFYIVAIISVFLALGYSGCSKLKDNLVIAPESTIHQTGWTDAGSANFHGNYISSKKWNMTECTQCHGTNFRGGSSGKDCNTCHTGGVTDCKLCHGSVANNTIWPPKALNGQTAVSYIGVGVHDIHMTRDSTRRNSARVRCVACHRSLSSYADTNHIGNNPDNIAEVKFDSLSITKTGTIVPSPVWNRTNKTCSGTYCHGNFKGGNTTAAPVWTTAGTLNCGTCHGNPTTANPLPPLPHPQYSSCWWCHAPVINDQMKIINKSLHINGVVNFTAQ